VTARIFWARPDDAAAIVAELIELLSQLSPDNASLDKEVLSERLRDERIRVVVASVDDRLVATATLTLLVTLTDGLVGRVEDVIVSGTARGAGVGRQLMEALHAQARELGVAYLDLTSRPSREAANALYASLGYERRETNVYRLRLR
jgi:ribosomal protein S18 acetylase RimI-like enzyme